MRHRATTIAVAAVAATAVAAPAATAATITMSGSTSVAPLVQELGKKYFATYRTGFKIQQGGSDTGINDVARGRVTIGNASRKQQSSDPGGLVFNTIAYDAVCIITNSANPLGTLSQDQVASIFTGRTRAWSQVPGAGASGSIELISRTATSGTADAFREIFLGNTASVAASAQVKTSNGLVQQSVAASRGAIGFVSLDFVRGGLKTVNYQGVPCTLRNAKSGQYQGVRPFSLVTRGAPSGDAKRFINWVKTSSAARAIINTHWIPLR
ncbi:phosphate ABC transporter substrate-binding protein [Conexibacter woesei]|uniref:Phosphate ABC transporter, periplasmic phosphate-binding protein n=1 Tax=Conexibacter woesei (strain DSM 14684 / CCUG 47730 / CIP 108061 / JCM 11494 / NBRC 100937 / ID131577) TaxID=469383 RepID=D3FA84_CONWI|nr:phosphate ABC transporter substrate-binding protein [Conexibacter woesei]ADB53179.1 phosphate ABC transporter, periplasmic phosphate- binding protein [Conexibacter woesei DSM 14684]